MTEEKDRFKIEDMGQLDWAFKMLSEAQHEVNEIKARANAQRKLIDDWEATETNKHTENMEYFKGLVHEYHMEQMRIDPKKKTLSTPFGESKSVTSKPQPEKMDDAKLLEYLKKNDLKDFIKHDAKWGDFKKTLKIAQVDGKAVVVDSDGQVVEGVSVKPETTNYSVKIK